MPRSNDHFGMPNAAESTCIHPGLQHRHCTHQQKGTLLAIPYRISTLQMLWMQSATSHSPSFKLKVLQVNPRIRPACDPEKQGACAKPSGDLRPRDQVRSKSPNTSRVITHDQSRDPICFERARSPLINKWKTVGMVFNQQRHMIPVKG